MVQLSMSSDLYFKLKNTVNTMPLSTAILAVKKDEDGNFAEMRYFVINKSFINDCMAIFFQNESDDSTDLEEKVKEIESKMEGALYTINVPREPKFEDACFRAAWRKEPIHTYVDTTKLYGYWTENFMLPIAVNENEKDHDIAYCMFVYTLNKEMDVNKYSSVSPDIASFVIKSCLELQSENDFYSSMQLVTDYIREYADAAGASVHEHVRDDRQRRSKGPEDPDRPCLGDERYVRVYDYAGRQSARIRSCNGNSNEGFRELHGELRDGDVHRGREIHMDSQ